MSDRSLSPAAPDLARENEELRQRLREAEELITAVRTGAVDALAIQSADGPRIFTLEGADHGYRTLIEQMNEGALLLSPEGTVLYCNAALAGVLHRPLEEVLGSEFRTFVPADFWDYWATLLELAWEEKARGELPLRNSRGELRPFAVSMNVLIFNGSLALAVLVTDLSAQQEIDSIRELVAAQNALLDQKNQELQAQQASRYAVEQAAAEARRIMEGIPHMAWTADAQGRPTSFNRRWYEYIGEDRQAFSPERAPELIHADDLPVALEHWQRSLQSGEALEMECRIRDAGGEFRWMLARALPSHGEQGHVLQWIGTYTDIHEHKLTLDRVAQAERQLRENNTRLTRANADLDNFIYTASHDLKAPITNIEGLLHALISELPADHRPGSQVPIIVDMMQDSVERFKRTIEHLTDLSRLQKQHSEEPVQLVDLAAVVQNVQLDLAPQLAASRAQLEVAVAGHAPVPFSEKNLRSVVYNLLSNALKYRDPQRLPRVTLRARVVGEDLAFSVEDNGLGLTPTQQSRLFGMFQRLHDHVEGSGIGLYMVKKIVDNAGGHVEVRSESGVGSTFTVFFPYK